MKASIIIPNRNDTIMLSITVRSALEELKSIDNDGEIIVVDNSDEDFWRVLKNPDKSPLSLRYVREGKVRLIRQSFPSLYSARQTAIEAAQGEYIINNDSHVLYGRNVVKDVVDFMDNDKEKKVGLGFSPIGWITGPEILARHDIQPNAKGSIFGPWGRRYYEPTKISWNFGFRIARRDWLLNECKGFGFFAKKQVSWGGGEFYIAMKSWLLGKENWAIPANPMYHIGPFSPEIERLDGHRYRLYGKSGNGKTAIGILAAFYALGGHEIKDYVRKNEVGLAQQYSLDIDRDWPEACRLAKEDRRWIKEHQVMSFQDLLEQQPWMEGWGDDRWSQWHPGREINEVFDLNELE